MKSLSLLSILTASLAPAITDALKPSKCGGSLTSACLSETDKRYDADYPVSIVEQNPTWNQFEGLWKITIKNYEGDGTPALPTPYNAAIDQGVPYTRDDVVGFYNHSLIGSRMSINRYYVFNPAPEAFCNQTFEPPFLNVAGPGVCGVNGYAFTAGQYGTSTHDNNGDVSFFRVYGGYSNLPSKLPYDLNPPGRFSWIDSSTLWGTNSVEGFFSQNNPYIFLDNNTALVNSNFISLVERRRGVTAISEMVRMEESEWIAAIEQAYDDSNVIESQRIPVPFQEFTLDPASYPTEEEWCGGVGNDPACTVSQFQEPDAKLKTGPLLGFIILGLAVFCIPLYAFYRYRIEQQERRIKAQFIRGVAKNISISPSAGALSQENLIAEFARIDKDNGGTIEKAELKAWIDEGKLGNISDKDFNALWSALDIDGSGTVDFVEFCTFLSGCGEAFDEVYDQQEKMSKQEKMKYASSRLLNSNAGDDEKDIEKDIKD